MLPLACLPVLLIATDPPAKATWAMAMMGQREHVTPSIAPAKKQVFYFDGEEMVKRDAMLQIRDFDIGDKENAEYPFPHVHTEEHEDVDPITRELV